METQKQVVAMGNNIVVPKGASLPPLCVKCGSIDVTTVERCFVWLEPVYYLTIIFSPLVFYIVYLIVRKKVRLSLPLCEQHRNLVGRMKIATAILLIGAPVTEVLLVVFASPEVAGLGVVGLLFALLGGLITLRLQRTLTAVRIDDDQAIFKGGCDIFLSQLPRQ